MTPLQLALKLAETQDGVVTWTQAVACGLTKDAVLHLVRTGRWVRVARSVYIVAGCPTTSRQRARVAVAAAPRDAVASHLTLLALFALCDAPLLPRVTVPPTSSARSRGGQIHRSTVRPEDRTVIHGIPGTTVSRALVDVAAQVPFTRLCSLVDLALLRELATPDTVWAAAARASKSPGRKGLPLVGRALEVWTPGPLPGSPAEMRLIRLIVAWGFPTPERQHPVVADGKQAYLDLAWPRHLVAVEYDGKEFHGPRQQPLDRARQSRLEAAGWRLARADRNDLRTAETRLRDQLSRWLPRS